MDQQRATRGEVADVEGQLRLLVKLQELELAIKQFEAAIAAKPHELDPLTRALDEARTSATTHRKDLESPGQTAAPVGSGGYRRAIQSAKGSA